MLILLEQNQRGEELEKLPTLCTSATQHRRADTTQSGKTASEPCSWCSLPMAARRAQRKPPEAGQGHRAQNGCLVQECLDRWSLKVSSNPDCSIIL